MVASTGDNIFMFGNTSMGYILLPGVRENPDVSDVKQQAEHIGMTGARTIDVFGKRRRWAFELAPYSDQLDPDTLLLSLNVGQSPGPYDLYDATQPNMILGKNRLLQGLTNGAGTALVDAMSDGGNKTIAPLGVVSWGSTTTLPPVVPESVLIAVQPSTTYHFWLTNSANVTVTARLYPETPAVVGGTIAASTLVTPTTTAPVIITTLSSTTWLQLSISTAAGVTAIVRDPILLPRSANILSVPTQWKSVWVQAWEETNAYIGKFSPKLTLVEM